jgi:glutaminase
MMAACLANGGTNPATGVEAVERRYVESILSVMGSCGMYDYAGEWIYRVGMPAKSGVSGGVLAVLPGQLGIGVFSPRLDGRGNSVRGVRVCADLSNEYSLHMLSVPNLGRSAIRVTYDAAEVRSKRQRDPDALVVLSEFGNRIQVYELQGDLVFASVEAISRKIAAAFDSFDTILIDFKHTGQIDTGGSAMMADLLLSLLVEGKRVALSAAPPHGFVTKVEELVGADGELALFADSDTALEWCEDKLLQCLAPQLSEQRVPVAGNELCQGLDACAIERLEAVTRQMRFGPGDAILTAGETGGSVYLLASGRVSVTIDRPSGGSARVATLSAGMMFGEMAMLSEAVRSANVHADSEVECYVLSVADLALLSESSPSLRATLYENLARKLAANLRRANAEVQALSG